MPEGIIASIDRGVATIEFLDKSLRGPALAKLTAAGVPIEVDTRSGPSKRYIVPEGNAAELGLIDGDNTVDSLGKGDTGRASALAAAQAAAHSGVQVAAGPDPTTSRNIHAAETRPDDILAATVSTTVDGSVPDQRIVPPTTADLQKIVHENTPYPADYAPERGVNDGQRVPTGHVTIASVVSTGGLGGDTPVDEPNLSDDSDDPVAPTTAPAKKASAKKAPAKKVASK